MIYDPFSAVRAICVYSGWTRSNLSIQKLLYIAHMIHLGRHSDGPERLAPLVRSDFFAWMYGPVVPSVYHELKMFGVKNVVDFSSLRHAPDPPSHPEESDTGYYTVKYVCDSLRGVDSHRLVAYTHSVDSAWSRHYNSKKPDTIIPKEAIYDEYQRRYGQKT